MLTTSKPKNNRNFVKLVWRYAGFDMQRFSYRFIWSFLFIFFFFHPFICHLESGRILLAFPSNTSFTELLPTLSFQLPRYTAHLCLSRQTTTGAFIIYMPRIILINHTPSISLEFLNNFFCRLKQIKTKQHLKDTFHYKYPASALYS